MSAPVLFVAGTDTGAGKTRVATALARSLRSRGVRVAPFKPVETGVGAGDCAVDAAALIDACGGSFRLDEVCPYRFRESLAPGVAAEREGRDVDPARIDERLEALRARADLVLCEGAGGLLVPFSGDLLNADWIAAHRLPVLLVGRLGLGTINHTLLSVRDLAARGIELLATVLSAVDPPRSTAEATNPEILGRFPEVRLTGVLGYGQAEPPATLMSRVRERFGLGA